jgi:hypothetical protein
VAGGRQIGGVDEGRGVFPKGGCFDQGLEQGFIDLSKSHHAQTRSKRVEDANIGHAMPMAQTGKVAPGRLLGQHL